MYSIFELKLCFLPLELTKTYSPGQSWSLTLKTKSCFALFLHFYSFCVSAFNAFSKEIAVLDFCHTFFLIFAILFNFLCLLIFLIFLRYSIFFGFFKFLISFRLFLFCLFFSSFIFFLVILMYCIFC